jgi:hypothetical protein
LHVLVGAECGEDGLALLFTEAAEIELIVIAKEESPLRGSGAGVGVVERLDERTAVGAGHGVEEVLIDIKVEHHLQALTGIAEVGHVGFRDDVGFAEDDGAALAPAEEFREGAEHVVLLRGALEVGAFFGNDEGDGVHAEAVDAELEPEAHDLEDLGLHVRVRGVEVGLEIVKAVEVVSARVFLIGPRGFLDAGKDHAGGRIFRFGVRPDIPIAVLRLRIAAGLLEP